MQQDATLAGSVAFITGANSGIGAAIAVRFAKAGARVAAIVREIDAGAKNTTRSIASDGGTAQLFEADVTDEAALERAFAAVTAAYGAPTILVNDAGVDASGTPVAEMSTAVFEGALRTNVFGPFFAARAFLNAIAPNAENARIINITSVHEDIPRAGAAEYCASKGALRNLTRCLALELAPRKITVNNIAPGMILTPMNQADLDDPKKLAQDEATIPLRRGGKPEEIAELALFLASPLAAYVTGSTYVMDGGLMQNLGQGA